jgi:hypothetical protein
MEILETKNETTTKLKDALEYAISSSIIQLRIDRIETIEIEQYNKYTWITININKTITPTELTDLLENLSKCQIYPFIIKAIRTTLKIGCSTIISETK